MFINFEKCTKKTLFQNLFFFLFVFSFFFTYASIWWKACIIIWKIILKIIKKIRNNRKFSPDYIHIARSDLITWGQTLAPTMPPTARKSWELGLVLPSLDIFYRSRVDIPPTQRVFTLFYSCWNIRRNFLWECIEIGEAKVNNLGYAFVRSLSV